MLFNSLEFLIFFPLVTLLYFLIPGLKSRNFLLLAASYYFYMQYKPEYALIMLISTFVDFWVALFMHRSRKPNMRKLWLGLSLCGNLGLLFYFKYFNFAVQSLSSGLSFLGISYEPGALSLLLPVGISFYTFQSLSYTVDVYRGDLEPEKDFFTFALYVSFFPQLVAGPIERATQLLPQFRVEHSFDPDRAASGLKLMLWGFFKKVVIADRLAVVVDTVYNNSAAYDGPYYLIATVAFAFQIFCDFSGYSDIAIGSARVIGFKLMTNFERPYLSKSVTEFWRRWHISLSTWFRDYVYIPLGGSRKGYARTLLNLFLIFLLSGLWHGASWTFVIWGALNGLAVVFEKILGIGKRPKAGSKDGDGLKTRPPSIPLRLAASFGGLIANGLTFAFILLTWVFFRARTVSEAFYMLPRFFTGFEKFDLSAFLSSRTILGLDFMEFFTALGALVILEIIHRLQNRISIGGVINKLPSPARLLVYTLALTTVIWLAWTQSQSFIYFAF